MGKFFLLNSEDVLCSFVLLLLTVVLKSSLISLIYTSVGTTNSLDEAIGVIKYLINTESEKY
jgi:hypothetical protein